MNIDFTIILICIGLAAFSLFRRLRKTLRMGNSKAEGCAGCSGCANETSQGQRSFAELQNQSCSQRNRSDAPEE